MSYERRRLVELACMLIREDPGARLTTLAGRCGVSVSTLGRAVRGATGGSVRRWRGELRLALAAKELVGTPLRTVKEVSATLGFAAPRAFARWFRRSTGLSPAEYRAASRRNPASAADVVDAGSRGDLPKRPAGVRSQSLGGGTYG